MKDFFTPSIITALTALTLSLITLYQFFRNLRFQQKQAENNQNRDLTNKLYDLRLEYYPKAYDITDCIIKEKGNNYDVQKIKNAATDLIAWKKGVVNIIISVECRDSFFTLRDALMKKPAEKGQFSQEQVVKIHNANKSFRKELRRDFGFMYREEKKRRKTKKASR
ncbi:hypothetical protein Q4517_04135 [Tenacibaculum sp. 1_MG-2023]|uniref:hypothetical protein n=1 Tax=Tenacibaculum sp. 1_MG-2023 TaxID=3062653 RepID=UPI0026E47EB6|nr:hypothetical protein [Tenacibaculum sp. 1_MG-2023]MDO6674734.1 hypothetical protein [Tenacibaculum sp. 1_MG-2023]